MKKSVEICLSGSLTAVQWFTESSRTEIELGLPEVESSFISITKFIEADLCCCGIDYTFTFYLSSRAGAEEAELWGAPVNLKQSYYCTFDDLLSFYVKYQDLTEKNSI